MTPVEISDRSGVRRSGSMSDIKGIAQKILAFDPSSDADCVVIGTKKPMHGSATGLTWQDVRTLALWIAPQPRKRIKANELTVRVYTDRL